MAISNPFARLAGNQQPVEEKAAEALPFTMQVANNPKVKGVRYGSRAMEASGAQPEFIAANMAQASATKSAVILRAGDPPQYNKDRSPKSGVNLSKTSKQGFFKGALSKELRFARTDSSGNPLPHNPKDAAHLDLKPTDPDYQHTMQLDINMRDIIREIRPGGDLEVLGFDEKTGLLRLAYKEGRGPKTSEFNGQFVINLYQGEHTPQFYSRDWDRPDNDPDWDVDNKIIKKPAALAALPEHIYKKIFEDTFVVGYTEEKSANPDPSTIKKAEVFANRPRSAEEFKAAMGEAHPHFALIKECADLPKILETLRTQLPQEEAEQTILEVYNRVSSIVAGDWDGMALGHPPSLDPKFAEVINVFKPGNEGLANIRKLVNTTQEYLVQIQEKAQQKKDQGMAISAFEEKVLSINHITSIASEFAIARAGCITPHEFLFQQVLNDAYRDKANAHYGETYNSALMQKAMDRLVVDGANLSKDEVSSLAKNLLAEEVKNANYKLSETLLNKFAEHLSNNLPLALKNDGKHYALPHIHHDMNVHDLYQHGFDMRNPYGSNLEGAWLLVTDDGGIIYGDTQEQLIEVLLTGDFLKKNHIDVSHGADFSAGWDRIIERQMALKQSIPEQTLEKYKDYLATRPAKGVELPLSTAPPAQHQKTASTPHSAEYLAVKANSYKSESLNPNVVVEDKAKSQQFDMKAGLKAAKAAHQQVEVKEVENELESEFKASCR